MTEAQTQVFTGITTAVGKTFDGIGSAIGQTVQAGVGLASNIAIPVMAGLLFVVAIKYGKTVINAIKGIFNVG